MVGTRIRYDLSLKNLSFISGGSLNHVDGFRGFFDPPPPPFVDSFTK